jgi:hypothetical protein
MIFVDVLNEFTEALEIGSEESDEETEEKKEPRGPEQI